MTEKARRVRPLMQRLLCQRVDVTRRRRRPEVLQANRICEWTDEQSVPFRTREVEKVSGLNLILARLCQNHLRREQIIPHHKPPVV